VAGAWEVVRHMINTLLTRFAGATTPCTTDGGGFFGIPHWYKYLPGVTDPTGACIPRIQSINDLWLIAAGVIDILLRIAVLLAIGFIVWAGIKFITSQGEPDKTKQARDIILDAIIGLAIAIVAATLVSFVAGKFKV
jgi:hypothetical protein